MPRPSAIRLHSNRVSRISITSFTMFDLDPEEKLEMAYRFVLNKCSSATLNRISYKIIESINNFPTYERFRRLDNHPYYDILHDILDQRASKNVDHQTHQ